MGACIACVCFQMIGGNGKAEIKPIKAIKQEADIRGVEVFNMTEVSRSASPLSEKVYVFKTILRVFRVNTGLKGSYSSMVW